MRYAPKKDSLKLGASAVASKFYEYIQVAIDLETVIVNIRSIYIHLPGFQLLLLLPKLIEMTFFDCTNGINLLCLKVSLGRIVIAVKCS